MTDTSKLCDRCRQAIVYWPGTLTILGTFDLCGECYWEYVELNERLAGFARELPRENARVGNPYTQKLKKLDQ